MPPATYFHASNASGASFKKNHARISPIQLPGNDVAQIDLRFYLANGVTWDNDVDVFGAWCETAKALFAQATTSMARSCTTDHAMVGKSVVLETSGKDVRGILRITSGCTFEVQSYRFDGTAPATFWWSSTAKAESSFKTSGKPISAQRDLPTSTGFLRVEEFYLNNNVTWESLDYIGAYCETAKALFAVADLGNLRVCSQDHALVGFTSDLDTRQHAVDGIITVLDSCSFEVRPETAKAFFWSFGHTHSGSGVYAGARLYL